MDSALPAKTVAAPVSLGEVSAEGIIDRLRELKKLFDIVERVGLDKAELGEIGKGIGEVVRAEGVKAKIEAAGRLLATVAKATTNTIDDAISTFANDVIKNHLDWIISLIPGAKDASHPPVTQSDVEAAGLDWAKISQIIMFIVGLVGKFV